VVEAACEKNLFASPETTAAALAYVDARISLIAAAAPFAERDPALRPMLERQRRALEADRYGLVAHVLSTRGCNGEDCQDLKPLRDKSKILANMQSRTFDLQVSAHAGAWNAGPAIVSRTGPADSAPSLAGFATGMISGRPPTDAPSSSSTSQGSSQGSSQAKYDFPSASSIPAVSIMNPEPGTPPPAPEAKPAAPPRRPAQTQTQTPTPTPRSQSASRPATPRPDPQAAAGPPQQILPPPPQTAQQPPPPAPETR
jgi:hypothetical protein